MPPLLFLAHRIPYPPNKGDKIRSYHLLRALSRRRKIFLGAFVDDGEDWRHASTLENWCEDVFFVPLRPARARIRSLRGLLSGTAMTVPYYADRRLQRWVDRVIAANRIREVVVFSSAMAQYVDGSQYSEMNRAMDFVDVDSEKWRSYAESERPALRWLYRREARKLLCYERSVAERFNSVWFVSPEEAELFGQRAPDSAANTSYYRNGVDSDYFRPTKGYGNPYRDREAAIVFTGAMDYRPNVDAVVWFGQRVLPMIRERHPRAVFYIVGGKPAEHVKRLARTPGIEVTGYVPDVRPYLAHCTCAVAPLHIARGVQNKVLEALAMARPVVATEQAATGIPAAAGRDLLVGRQEDDFAAHVCSILEGRVGPEMARAGRQLVIENFSWEACLGRFTQAFFGKTVPNEGRAAGGAVCQGSQ